jgi:superfamily II DNA or RNA helicase
MERKCCRRSGSLGRIFVAHREEILAQAMATFRRIRPQAHLGLYNGQSHDPHAEVLFASVQTLSRVHHLQRFEPGDFDYVIIDEFHHATARTYRRIIDYFEPQFTLGLTATPERMDGGDLLALCQYNRVYRCDIPRAIELNLLCPFHYYGVPDDVDYAQIPWRNRRFDTDALRSIGLRSSGRKMRSNNIETRPEGARWPFVVR